MSVSSHSTRQTMSGTISRRRLLQMSGLGMLELGFPQLLSARQGGTGKLRPTEKACIFILLCGGPSHIDTWDLKPAAPAEIRGPYKPIATKVPGMRISELHTRLAKLTDKFCLIRSMSHPGNISNHFDAMHNCLSGQAGAPADAPYLGSILAKLRPSRRSAASYVWLIKCVGDPVFCAPNIGTGGSLGLAYAPLFVGSAANNPSMPNFRPPDLFASTATLGRMRGRHDLLHSLDRGDGVHEESRATRQWQDLHQHAFDLATSLEARQAFSLEQECPKVRDRYGRHPLGQNLLLARRLVESGVGFITVNGWTGVAPGEKLGGPPSSSWDMHGGEMGMGNAFGNGSYGMGWCLPRLDEALSALLVDLEERGLLDSTLVVVAGEFGRTPRINAPTTSPGRQHWPVCYSAILAGAGIRGGQVYGESDKIGAYVKDNPVRPQDLGATIYHALGVSLEPQMTREGATKALTSGKPLMALFG